MVEWCEKSIGTPNPQCMRCTSLWFNLTVALGQCDVRSRVFGRVCEVVSAACLTHAAVASPKYNFAQNFANLAVWHKLHTVQCLLPFRVANVVLLLRAVPECKYQFFSVRFNHKLLAVHVALLARTIVLLPAWKV